MPHVSRSFVASALLLILGCKSGGDCETPPTGTSKTVTIDEARAWVPASSKEQTECSASGGGAAGSAGAPTYPDQCGCDGKTCPSGQRCVRAEKEVGQACPGPLINQCVAVCEGDDACPAGTACLPFSNGEVRTCREASCRSDGDCGCGRCRVQLGVYSQCHGDAVLAVGCY